MVSLMIQFDIAIVIPCFNGWKYMKRCLESLEQQQIKPAQIIIVDDCSTDDSYQNLLAYSQDTSLPVEVYRNDINCGPAKSREKALRYVSTEYVAFCDCDDWYEIDFVKSIYELVSKNDSTVDLVIFSNYICREENSKQIDSTTHNLVDCRKEEILALYSMSLCRMAIRSEIIKRIPFPDLYHAEDGVVATQIIADCNKILIFDKPLYNYLTRYDSASTKPDYNTYLEFESAYRLITKSLASKYPREIEFLGVKYICYGAVLNAFKCDVRRAEVISMIERFERENPFWYKNRYCGALSHVKRLYIYGVRKRYWTLVSLLTKIHTRLVE